MPRRPTRLLLLALWVLVSGGAALPHTMNDAPAAPPVEEAALDPAAAATFQGGTSSSGLIEAETRIEVEEAPWDQIDAFGSEPSHHRALKGKKYGGGIAG
jgi:hypothetical protein